MLALFRVVLIGLTVWVVLFLSYYESTDEQGFLAAIFRSFAMKDPIDCIAVVVSIGAIVWFVPRLTITCLLFPSCLKDPGIAGILSALSQARQHLLHRKTFVFAGALIVCIAALVTHFNPKEFNPNIRPLAAVLRSNFWLAIHVITFMIGYAAGLIAWLLALASLGMYAFGRYRKVEGKTLPPAFCDTLAPYILKSLQLAVWMIIIGTILGARWADYSWGRFWSWDVKEVWALISILVFLFVLHGRIARYYGELGVAIGAVFGAIAIIMTWYGFNFVFKVGRHAYGQGDSSLATYIVLGFIIVNIVWTMFAVGRYAIESKLSYGGKG